ncbi:MAG: PAS domain-containing protein [Thermodesulfobacteriota bacterium]
MRESDKRFRLTLDATSDGVWDRNLVTGETFYGNNWARLLGYTADDMKNPALGWKKLLHPDDKIRALAAVKENLSGRTEHYNVEFRLRNKAGQWQ